MVIVEASLTCTSPMVKSAILSCVYLSFQLLQVNVCKINNLKHAPTKLQVNQRQLHGRLRFAVVNDYTRTIECSRF